MVIKRDQSFFYVCAICGYKQDVTEKREMILGTGLFVSKDSKYYILTASHVVSSQIPVTHIKLSDINKLTTSINLASLNPSGSWLSHPIADMSVFEIDSSINPWITARSFPYDHCEIQMNSFSRDLELTTVGFPCGFGADIYFTPLTFRSYPSIEIISMLRADRQIVSDFFLLEDPSIGGYSGGPVFDLGYKIDGLMMQKRDRTKLYGIMHGFVGNGTTGGEMSAVTPISYLKDII